MSSHAVLQITGRQREGLGTWIYGHWHGIFIESLGDAYKEILLHSLFLQRSKSHLTLDYHQVAQPSLLQRSLKCHNRVRLHFQLHRNEHTRWMWVEAYRTRIGESEERASSLHAYWLVGKRGDICKRWLTRELETHQRYSRDTTVDKRTDHSRGKRGWSCTALRNPRVCKARCIVIGRCKRVDTETIENYHLIIQKDCRNARIGNQSHGVRRHKKLFFLLQKVSYLVKD